MHDGARACTYTHTYTHTHFTVPAQTKGLKSGSTIMVCTMAAVASVVTGVLAGLLALGEALPSSPGMVLGHTQGDSVAHLWGMAPRTYGVRP